MEPAPVVQVAPGTVGSGAAAHVMSGIGGPTGSESVGGSAPPQQAVAGSGVVPAGGAPRDKYRVVPKAKTSVGENEIRVTNAGRLNRYVTYAARLLSDNGQRSITIRATGNAIAGAITLSEILKRRFANLHQQNIIGITTISDVYEPLEEGLDEVRRERNVPFIEIIIAVDASCLNVSDPGYQEPIDQSLVKPYTPEVPMAPGSIRGGRGRSRGRGGFAGRSGAVNHNGGGNFPHREPYRGRYRGGRRSAGAGGSPQQQQQAMQQAPGHLALGGVAVGAPTALGPVVSTVPAEIVMTPNYPQSIPQQQGGAVQQH